MSERKMSELEQRAKEFATLKHAEQVRKYTGDPYIVHPRNVAGLVASIDHTEEMLAAAWLHDVVEDCGVNPVELVNEFNIEVAELVVWLSNVSRSEDGNRAARKELDRLHTAKSPAKAQTIKAADLIDNSYSILIHDPSFAKIYIREKRELLNSMPFAEPKLIRLAWSLVGLGKGEIS